MEQLFKGIGGATIIDESICVWFVLDTKDASDDGMVFTVPRDVGFGHESDHFSLHILENG